ncbi:hypothetical protein J2741_002426 [Methanolinea mesophila]|nr:hypothetical protein [Methanolinea mesophila]
MRSDTIFRDIQEFPIACESEDILTFKLANSDPKKGDNNAENKENSGKHGPQYENLSQILGFRRT